MKTLTRVKLINWHRFTNATIEFGASTLLSGENGAGKSTLLDAIQFVVTCTANNFNRAAHENGKRKLTGYIRCKTGKENKPYERTGEISAHVALEFYEDSKQQYFVVGAVIDSASEGQEKTVRYLMNHTRFTDDMFFQGKTPRSINQFHSANSGKIKMWCKTAIEAKKMIKTRFGRIEDKFFTLIPKALAFRSIDDIKDFVYSYVLDEKEVNIDILRENVRTYQELEKTLESVKRRIARLEIIEGYHSQVMDGLAKDKMYDYFLERAEADILGERFSEAKSQLQMEKYRLEQQEKKIRATTDEKNERQQMRDALMAELAKDEDFLALDGQKKELQKLQTALQEQEEERKNLLASVKASRSQVTKLLALKDADPCFREYDRILKNLEMQEDISEVKFLTRKVIACKKQMYDENQLESAKLQVQLNDRKAKRLELDKKIEQLKQKKLTYPEEVVKVRQAAEEEFREQFLAKLQENMKQAQSEFKELNRALRDIIFSNEKYEFIHQPSKRYRQYYEMIMDDFNAIQGESIFSGLFHENHKEVIDELFEKLALDNENSAQALDEFTDYRTYMDYDIKIVHSDNSYSYYSKVCEEKSGGETQTPFYVTVAASFVQLYSNNIGGEAIGLVMFDEAFNNMDDERIGGVLEFLRRLPLQIIIAAPPDKIQYISSSVEETLLVMTDEKVSFVERYHNGAV